jgi:hypothetical protein
MRLRSAEVSASVKSRCIGLPRGKRVLSQRALGIVAHDMPSLADDLERHLTLRQADQARSDFAAMLDELEFVKEQLALMPTRAYVSRMALMATASVFALIAAVALMLAR